MHKIIFWVKVPPSLSQFSLIIKLSTLNFSRKVLDGLHSFKPGNIYSKDKRNATPFLPLTHSTHTEIPVPGAFFLYNSPLPNPLHFSFYCLITWPPFSLSRLKTWIIVFKVSPQTTHSKRSLNGIFLLLTDFLNLDKT